MRVWLEHDPIALAVLVFGIAAVEFGRIHYLKTADHRAFAALRASSVRLSGSRFLREFRPPLRAMRRKNLLLSW